METQIGPRAPHSEECRLVIETAIGADENDNRAKKAQERLEHYAGQQVETGDERKNDPREIDEPIIEENQNITKDETMDKEVEEFDFGTPGKMSMQENDVISEE